VGHNRSHEHAVDGQSSDCYATTSVIVSCSAEEQHETTSESPISSKCSRLPATSIGPLFFLALKEQQIKELISTCSQTAANPVLSAASQTTPNKVTYFALIVGQSFRRFENSRNVELLPGMMTSRSTRLLWMLCRVQSRVQKQQSHCDDDQSYNDIHGHSSLSRPISFSGYIPTHPTAKCYLAGAFAVACKKEGGGLWFCRCLTGVLQFN
jgi:hypothetical protein